MTGAFLIFCGLVAFGTFGCRLSNLGMNAPDICGLIFGLALIAAGGWQMGRGPMLCIAAVIAIWMSAAVLAFLLMRRGRRAQRS